MSIYTSSHRPLARCAAVFLLLVSATACAAEFDQSWVAPKYALCEGVGAAGSFRVYVSGSTAPAPGGARAVRRLATHISSAAFGQFQGELAARVTVKVGGSVKQGEVLARPAGHAIEPAPAPGESRRLYLRDGATLLVPPTGELWITVTPTVRTEAGACVLGSSEQRVDLH